MSNPFFDRPILNSPYDAPTRHWELDEDGQPTQQIKPSRRVAAYVTPIPKPRKSRAQGKQATLTLDSRSTQDQAYDPTPIINAVREQVAVWRMSPESHWGVTPETARLLKHWRHHDFKGLRPFFCQVEAVETAMWLTEVASTSKSWRNVLEKLEGASQEANPGLSRLALKLATGAGKTTVMAMLIAWQTVNAVRRKGSTKFTRGFLVVTPGLTIKDRLRVLQLQILTATTRTELVPADMLEDNPTIPLPTTRSRSPNRQSVEPDCEFVRPKLRTRTPSKPALSS